ncbi:MAG TPA: nucleoside deaminase [Bradyrhizobium sp.]|jgi:Cytosine/adenosine deaminases
MLAKTDQSAIDAIDAIMMERCIRLSATAVQRGEFPFAAVICKEDGEVVVESINQVALHADVTRHAELVAVSEAQRILGRKDLSGCTLYSTVEPCAMCSFPIRETRIGRVVFAINSPMMGGFSKWNVLRDGEISRVMPEAFGPVPEVIAGLSRRAAEKIWWTWNPLIWWVIKQRGCFGPETASDRCKHLPAIRQTGSLWRRLLMRLRPYHSA